MAKYAAEWGSELALAAILEQTLLAKTEDGAAVEYQVIEHCDVEGFSCKRYPLRDLQILGAGPCISTGMIMRQDYTSAIISDCWPENLREREFNICVLARNAKEPHEADLIITKRN